MSVQRLSLFFHGLVITSYLARDMVSARSKSIRPHIVQAMFKRE